MQRSRRHDPYPLTWEIPTLVIGSSLLLLVLGVHAGRGVATLISGAGWTWPLAGAIFRSLPAVLDGDASAGLAAVTGPIPDRGAVVGWVLITEAILAVAVGWVTWLILQRWGPNRLKGVANADEAERLLGRTRLYRARRIVRPDLHGRGAEL